MGFLEDVRRRQQIHSQHDDDARSEAASRQALFESAVVAATSNLADAARLLASEGVPTLPTYRAHDDGYMRFNRAKGAARGRAWLVDQDLVLTIDGRVVDGHKVPQTMRRGQTSTWAICICRSLRLERGALSGALYLESHGMPQEEWRSRAGKLAIGVTDPGGRDRTGYDFD